MIHPSCKYWESSPETTSHEVVACKNRGGVFGVCITQIVENGVEKEEGAYAEEAGTDDRHDPVDVWTGRPAEHKEADWDGEAADERAGQPLLWGYFLVFVELGLGVFIEVPEERGAVILH